MNSTDGGNTWNPSKRISGDDGYNSEGPKIAVNGSNIHVIWVDSRHGAESSPPNTEIYYNRSLDGGITWEGEQRLTNALYASADQDIAVNDSNIHIVWEDGRSGNWEIYYKMSKDNGATWQDGQGNIGADRLLTTNATDHMIPRVAVNGSTIHVVWVDEVWPGPEYYLYYRNSTDNGFSWSPIRLLAGGANGPNRPDIAVCGDEVHIVWDAAYDDKDIYYINSTDAGKSWSSPLRISVNDTFESYWPRIAVDDSMVHVAWYDGRDSNYEIYYKRYPAFPPYPNATINLTLHPGWNLISIPTEEPDWSLEAVFASIDGRYDCIQTYDASNGVWLTHEAGAPEHLNSLTVTNREMGLWVHVTGNEPVTLPLYGNATYGGASVQLHAGWNLVGYPTLAEGVTFSQALAGIPWDIVQTCDQARPYNLRYMPADATMEPGRGYWVHVTEDATWVVKNRVLELNSKLFDPLPTAPS